jgi:molybdenum cofactor cytidylyltransferase
MIAGLILAAGESSRMRSDKALLVYRGRTFLETIILNLRHAGIEKIKVVLGHHAEKIQQVLDLAGVQVVLNRHYQRGQTSSLQGGLAALREFSPEAVILCLVDHPAVTADVMRRLRERFEEGRASVVIPTYEGQRGHPVVISRELFPELLALRPNEGANTIIHKYRAATQFVEVDDRGILLDVDDPDTYERLERNSARL